MQGNDGRTRSKLLLLLFGILVLGSGCRQTKLNGVELMLNHPQFPAAAKAAPQFTEQVLNKLAEYEYELEKK